MTCPACAHENRPGARFCEACGAGLAARDSVEGERKQVTVLFTDVVGSMGLAETLDAERLRVVMGRLYALTRTVVQGVEGIVATFTGDGVMALFGAPVAHEDHARRACLAALELRRRLPELARELSAEQAIELTLRMGLNSGEVVVGAIGDDQRLDYTAIGQTVGLAKRVEALAPTNAIALSAATADLVTGEFELDELGLFEVRGVSGAQRVFVLRGPARAAAPLTRARGRLSALVGRDDEHAALAAGLERALEGRGRVISLVGEPGIGKSRLAHEFALRCAADGIAVHRVAALAHGRRVPLLPVLELWRSVLGVDPGEEPELARAHAREALLRLDPELAEDLPVILGFLGIGGHEVAHEQLDPEARQRRLLTLLRRFMHARSRLEPAVLILEDLHWLDDASEVFLEELVRGAAATRTLVVATFRPEYRATWLDGAHCEQLTVPELSEDAIGELLGELLGADPSVGGVSEIVARRASGNPFFCEELVRAMAESGHLVGDRGRYRLGRELEDLVLPATAQAVLGARIDRLGPREKAVLGDAAVIGRVLPRAVLDEITGLPPDELSAVLDSLVTAELLVEDGAQYAFKHPLTQEVAYRSQLSDRRRRAHAAVLEAMQRLYPGALDERAALLAHHAEGAAEPARAAEWHARAAAWTARTSPADGLRHWQMARRLADGLPEGPERATLGAGARLGILSQAWRLRISREEADAVHAEAMALLGDGPESAPARMLVDQAHHGTLIFGGFERDGLESARGNMETAEQLGAPALLVTTAAARGFAALILGRAREAFEAADRGLAAAGDDPSVGAGMVLESPYAHCLIYRGYAAAWLGRTAAGARDLDRARTLARTLGGETPAYVGIWSSFLHLARADAAAALAEAEEALATAEQVANVVALAGARYAIALACVVTGDFERASLLARQGLELVEARRVALNLTPGFQRVLAEASLGEGRPHEAVAPARRASTTARARSLVLVELQAQPTLARVLLATGEPGARDEAEAAVERAEELLERHEALLYEPDVEAARAALAESETGGRR